jgi:hypothetical protein
MTMFKMKAMTMFKVTAMRRTNPIGSKKKPAIAKRL